LKLYFDAAYTDAARAIGYAGRKTDDMRKELAVLSKQHDKEKLIQVIGEIADITKDTVTLKPEARKLCWQLLGFPPEYKHPEPMAEVKETKTTRKKRGKA
jgi:hypothetical protein